MTRESQPPPLARRLEPTNWNEPKQSVKDCLRSKAIPCTIVKALLKENIHPTELEKMYHYFIQKVLPELQHGGDQSSAYYLTQCAVVFRFIQLLLEKKQQNWTQQVQDLLEQLIRSVLLGSTVQDDSDDINSYSGPLSLSYSYHQLLLFTTGSLLRLNHYVLTVPVLLAPVWKGLTTLVATTKLPPAICDLAVQQLIQHLEQGVVALSSSINTDIEQQQRLTKIAAFLVSRLTTFVGSSVTLKTPLVTTVQVERVLSALTGLGSLCENAYHGLAKKAIACFEAWSPSLKLFGKVLGLIVEVEGGSSDDNDILSKATCIGRTILLLQVLEKRVQEQMTVNPEDPIQLCQELLVRQMPLCYNHLMGRKPSTLRVEMTSRTVAAVSAALLTVTCQVVVEKEDHLSLFFELAGWLTSPLHPLARELVLTCLCLWTTTLALHHGVAAVAPWLRLLIGLAWDGRTKTSMRVNLVAILLRLRQNEDLATKISALVSERHAMYLKTGNKRKREQKRCGEPASLSLRDIEALAVLVPNETTSGGPSFNSKVHTISLIEGLLGAPNGESTVKAVANGDFRKKHYAILTVSILRSRAGSLERGEAIDSLEQLCKLVERCTKQNVPLPLQSAQLESIRFLQVVGKALTSHTPSKLVQTLGLSFHSLLSHSNWSVRTASLTSFVHFASLLPIQHKSVLPKVVPPSVQPLLQKRLKKTPAPMDPSRKKQVFAQCSATLATIVPPQQAAYAWRRATNPLPLIEPGSLVFTLPTRGGRCAMVVFRPGKESRQDIANMLSVQQLPDGDSNDGSSSQSAIPTIWQYVSASCQEDGSCQLVVQNDAETHL